MRVILTFLGLVSSLGACQATSNHPLASDAYSVWCREQTEIYRTWHASQPESQQRLADELVANLTQFLFHPPPGDEKHPRQTIAGWRERYLATVSNLGTRLRAFERST